MIEPSGPLTAHRTTGSATGASFSPLATALNRTRSPVRILAVFGSTASVRTGFRTTLTAALDFTAPAKASIVAVPGATPVTKPDSSTVAIAAFDVDHFT